jgi:hypothetical protein
VNYEEGQVVGQAALDVVAKADEQYPDATLLWVRIEVVLRNGQRLERVVAEVPGSDNDD